MTPGGAWCFDACRDLNLTGDHCGSCGNRCPTNTLCRGGMCCTPGFGNCNGNPADGCETPLDTATNCGICGNPCPRPRACIPTMGAGGVIVGHRCNG